MKPGTAVAASATVIDGSGSPRSPSRMAKNRRQLQLGGDLTLTLRGA